MKEVWRGLFVLAVLLGDTSESILGSPANWTLSQDGLLGLRTENVSSPRLCIRIYDLAEIPTASLSRALKEADRLFQQAGIEIQWVECAGRTRNAAKAKECDQPVGPLRLNVKISFSRGNTGPIAEDTLFGMAEPYDRGGVEATLYYDHIDTFARSGSASQSLVLAHALAHEVGHLLLWSKSHSLGGIMKASWARRDLKTIEQGKLAFSLEEAQSLKANLLRRQMHYQLIMASDGSVRKQGD
jgi:hypothetical protein